jgi:hypothetical protein
MVADGITKALAKDRHWRVIEKMGMKVLENNTTPSTNDQQVTRFGDKPSKKANKGRRPMAIDESGA